MQAQAAMDAEGRRETARLRAEKRCAALEERNAELEAALTEVRDILPIVQDNYSRRVFAVAADALEPDKPGC